MAWPTFTVDVTQNSNQIKVYGAVPASQFPAGFEAIINGIGNLEVSYGTAIMYDGSNNPYSHLYLVRPYKGLTASNVEMVVKPTGSQFNDVVGIFQNGSNLLNNTMEGYRQFVEGTSPVSFQPLDENAEPVSIKPLQMMNQEAQAALDAHEQSINVLLANKTADGDDTTPGALLAVGATVKQLDLTNSNVRYEPSVKPTLRADFANNKYTLYDSETNTYVDKSITDVFDITRDTPTTVTTPTGKVINIGIHKPAFDFESGVQQGIRAMPQYANLFSWSEDFSNGVWAKPVGFTVDSTPDESPVESVNWTRFTAGSSGYIRQLVSISPGSVKRTLYTVVKYDGTSTIASIRTAFTGGTPVFESVTINLLTGKTNSASAKSYPLSQGAWLFSHTFQDNGTNNAIDSRLYPTDIGASVETDTALFAVAQLTATPCPVSYIKTEDSTITRAADSVTRVLGEEFNSNECTVFVEWDNLIDDDKVRSLLKAQLLNSVGSSWRGFGIESDSVGGVRAIIRDSSSNYDARTVITEPITKSGKAALSLKNGVFSAAINGKSNVLTGSELPSAFKDMIYLFVGCGARLGGGVDMESYQSGATILNAEIYPRAFDSLTLQRLTRI